MFGFMVEFKLKLDQIKSIWCFCKQKTCLINQLLWNNNRLETKWQKFCDRTKMISTNHTHYINFCVFLPSFTNLFKPFQCVSLFCFLSFDQIKVRSIFWQNFQLIGFSTNPITSTELKLNRKRKHRYLRLIR